MPDAAFPVAVLAGRQAAPFAEHPGEIELIREARRECCFADRRLRIGAPVLFGFFEAALDQQFLEAGLVVAAEELRNGRNAAAELARHFRQPDFLGTVLLEVAVDVVTQPVALEDREFAHADVINQHFEKPEHVFELFGVDFRQGVECRAEPRPLFGRRAPFQHAVRDFVIRAELADHQESGQFVMDEHGSDRFAQARVAAVVDDAALCDGFGPLGGVHRKTLLQRAELLLDHRAVVAVAHMLAAAQLAPVHGEEGHAQVQHCGEVVDQGLNLIAQKQFERSCHRFFPFGVTVDLTLRFPGFRFRDKLSPFLLYLRNAEKSIGVVKISILQIRSAFYIG